MSICRGKKRVYKRSDDRRLLLSSAEPLDRLAILAEPYEGIAQIDFRDKHSGIIKADANSLAEQRQRLLGSTKRDVAKSNLIIQMSIFGISVEQLLVG
jgi:hypothetical protein